MPKELSIYERVKQFKSDGFFIFDLNKRIVMCKYCNGTVDWIRKDSCRKHVATSGHQRKKELFLTQEKTVKQVSISTSIAQSSIRKNTREVCVMDFTKMLLEANIPIEKADDSSVREWLDKYVPGRPMFTKY